MPEQSESNSVSYSRLSERIFPGAGALAHLCREKDWSQTPLGPIENWPPSLRTVAGLVVAAPVPMIVLWGPELIQIYNDGYREVMGSKHPAGLGQPTRDCWPEVWEFNAPLYEGVMRKGESFSFTDRALVIERHGQPEEAFFTLSYSPVLDDRGEVGGVLVTVVETSEAVRRERAEDFQRESEERLRMALEAADLGTWDLDLVSDTASSRSLRHDQMFGYQERQANWGKEIAERHVLPEDRPTFTEAFARAKETGQLSFEVRVRWPDGSIHWIAALGRTYYDSSGHPVRMAGVVADVTDRNRIQALRDSEERFRLMADAVPQIVWITDAEGRVEFFNSQWAAYTGRVYIPSTAAEVAADTIHPDDVAITMERFEEALRSGKPFRVEHRIRAADGEYRWFLVRAEPYRDRRTGQIIRWFGASVDIHDRRVAEARLRESAAVNTYRVALDNALRPVADPADVKSVAAQTLGEQLGASRVLYGEISEDGEEVVVQADYCSGMPSVVGRHRLNDYGPMLIAEIRAGRVLVANNVSEDSRLSAAEREATLAIGVGAHSAVPLIKNGRLVAILSVHQSEPRKWTDTELAIMEETAERTWAAVARAQAEAALRDSEAKYRTLFESMDQGFGVAELIFDAEGSPVDFRWVETNPAFERHTGFSAASGKTVRALVPQLEQHWFDIYGRVATSGEPAQFVEWSDFLNRWFEVYAFRFGEHDQPRVAVLFTDITERKHTEETIQRANARLIESDRRKDEFLAMLAHELRNPLAAIGNTVKLMERRLTKAQSEEADSQVYLDILNRQTNMLRGLVADLLDVSRITRGLVELKQTQLDLADIAERALQSVQSMLDEKQHEVSVTLPRRSVPVLGDPVRLEQIIANLLTNAAKYTDPGGRIALNIERRSDRAELIVRDTGIGMSAEVLERIFDLFGQAERGLARSEGGLGIGLTIVKNLVELHGGQIQAHSEGPGRGAEFIVSLPVATEVQAPAEIAELPEQPKRVVSKRVLVVDDSKDIADTMALLLEAQGHQIAVATDGPSALQKAEAFHPDIVLLDIGLPGMDGYEVARRLRQNPQTQHATLAALTGYGQAADIERAHQAGFAKHFTKPVDIESLEAFIGGQT